MVEKYQQIANKLLLIRDQNNVLKFHIKISGWNLGIEQISFEIFHPLLELLAEIVPNVCSVRQITVLLPRFLRDGVSRDLSKDATYFGAQFVFPFPFQLIKLVYSRANRSRLRYSFILILY